MGNMGNFLTRPGNFPTRPENFGDKRLKENLRVKCIEI
jgi:hypothetical protein